MSELAVQDDSIITVNQTSAEARDLLKRWKMYGEIAFAKDKDLIRKALGVLSVSFMKEFRKGTLIFCAVVAVGVIGFATLRFSGSPAENNGDTNGQVEDGAEGDESGDDVQNFTVGGDGGVGGSGNPLEGGTGPFPPYTVQQGDNLFRIAYDRGFDVNVIAAFNGIPMSADGTYALIHPGQVINFPAGEGQFNDVALTVETQPQAAASTVVNGAPTYDGDYRKWGTEIAPGWYVVNQGDTLSGISSLFGTTVGQLVAWNGIANPAEIDMGQLLRVR